MVLITKGEKELIEKAVVDGGVKEAFITIINKQKCSKRRKYLVGETPDIMRFLKKIRSKG